MDDQISVAEQINNPITNARHLIILGAGASRAACPNGDKNGRKIPLMNEIGTLIGISCILKEYGVEYNGENFEEFFSRLIIEERDSKLIGRIEKEIYQYFNSLVIPDTPTVYDYLILSLREKDVIATFNWDPLLFQALYRNKQFPCPHVLFLHGNTAIGHCPSMDHKWVGPIGAKCPDCDKKLTSTKLLYPVTNKDYTTDPFIKNQWKTFEEVINEDSFIITIFGYSAPKTDIEARDAMKKAWDQSTRKDFGEIEVINIDDEEKIYKTWKPFIVRSHYRIYKSFFESLSHRWPRRSCEQVWNQFFMLRLTEKNTQPIVDTLYELQKWHLALINAERNASQSK
mgnify:CR=1 FL=1